MARPDYLSLLDHPNFENPASDVSAPVTVGKITALSVNARIMQGGWRWSFDSSENNANEHAQTRSEIC